MIEAGQWRPVTVPQTCSGPEFTHTSVSLSSGMPEASLARWRVSKLVFCFPLNSAVFLLNSGKYVHLGTRYLVG